MRCLPIFQGYTKQPKFYIHPGFLPEFFLRGGESIAMQISFVMLSFLLFSDQISGGEVSEGGKLPQGPPVEESQHPFFRLFFGTAHSESRPLTSHPHLRNISNDL